MSILWEYFLNLDFLEGVVGGVVVRAPSRHGGPKFGKGVRRPNIRRHVVRLGVDGLRGTQSANHFAERSGKLP